MSLPTGGTSACVPTEPPLSEGPPPPRTEGRAGRREETQYDGASSFRLLSRDEGQEGALWLLPPLPGPSWSPVAGPSGVSPGHLTQISSAELGCGEGRRAADVKIQCPCSMLVFAAVWLGGLRQVALTLSELQFLLCKTEMTKSDLTALLRG